MPTSTDLLAIINNRTRANMLGAIQRHQSWVKFHAQTEVDRSSAMMREPWVNFMRMVEQNVDDAKVEVFRSLCRPPFPTTEVCSVAFDRLSRIFEGRNPSFEYQFKTTDARDNWEWYRHEVLKERDMWRNKAWEFYRTEPNSIIVVDIPVNGGRNLDGTNRPEPYFYFVPTSAILNYGTDGRGNIEWVLWQDETSGMAYYCDAEYYRTFRVSDDNVAEMVSENAHTLGYCPSRFFVKTPVSIDYPDVKRSPITDILADLDWYLFYSISERHLDLYASWPIISGVSEMCGWEGSVVVNDNTVNARCMHGTLVDDEGNVLKGPDGSDMICPICGSEKHKFCGPGTTYMRDPYDQDGKVNDVSQPVSIVHADTDALENVTNKRKKMKEELIASIVGVEGDAISEFSVSDKQIDAGFESQSTILIRTKEVFEDAQKWTDETMCRLRYGDDFESCSIGYGTEFYMTTTSELRKRYQSAKDSGASQADLAAIARQIVETEYRNNPTLQQKMLILADIEPMLGMSRTEAKEAYDAGLCDTVDILIKLDFASLIQRFERENGSIIEWHSDKEYTVKVDEITAILQGYVAERARRVEERAMAKQQQQQIITNNNNTDE